MNIKKHLSAFILFFFSGIYITYPLIFHMGDYVTGYGDELVYSWIFHWVIQTFLSGNILNLLNTNIFYPYTIALSSSDPLLISSILSLIPFVIVKEPIVVVNFTIISSIIFLGFSIYLLSYYLTKDFWASLFSGILVIFSPAFLSFYMHLQMVAIIGVPLAILFFFKFLSSGKLHHLTISLSFFVLQTYNNFIAGYFILFSYLVIFFINWLWRREQLLQRVTAKNIVVLLLSFVLIIPIMLPYIQVSREFNYVRDIRETVHLAIQPEDLFFSSGFSRLQPYLNTLPFNRVSQNNEFKPGYLGFIFTLLAIGTIIFFVKHFKKKDVPLTSFVTIGLTGLVLSLGPVLHLGRQTIHEPFLIPLPYAFFYYLIPGFQGFRNTARWEMLFILAIAVAIAIVLVKILKRFNTKKRVIIYLLLIIGCIAEYNFPMQFYRIPSVKEFPKVYSWLATTPNDAVIIEMPVYNWDMPYAVEEFWRLYYSTIHFKRTVNGAGGFTPPPWEKMAYKLTAEFPSEESIEYLRKMGVRYLIVHKDEYDKMYKDGYKINNTVIKSGDEVIEMLTNKKSIRFIEKFGNDFVYSFY